MNINNDIFLQTIDGMIESTEEFILDDTSPLHDPKQLIDQLVRGKATGVADRMRDLQALERVRELYDDAFRVEPQPEVPHKSIHERLHDAAFEE